MKLKNLTITGMSLGSNPLKGYALHATHRDRHVFASHFPRYNSYNAAVHGKGRFRWLSAEQAERLWDELYKRAGDAVHDARWP